MAVLKCRSGLWPSLLSAQGRGKNSTCRSGLWPSLVVVGFLAAGCSSSDWWSGSGSGDSPVQEKAFAIDAVKLIRPDIERGDEEATYSQSRYMLNAQARLLLRYESLSEKKSVLETKPLRLRLYGATPADVDAIRAHARVCPITRPWMMAATWASAHPWRKGEWAPGGDLDEAECVAADAVAADGLCTEADAVCFDLTRWYKLWISERPDAPENYGFALVTGVPFMVYGDAAPARAPRIQWFETASPM